MKKGFTLVELLVVIAVIAIVATMMLPLAVFASPSDILKGSVFCKDFWSGQERPLTQNGQVVVLTLDRLTELASGFAGCPGVVQANAWQTQTSIFRAEVPGYKPYTGCMTLKEGITSVFRVSLDLDDYTPAPVIYSDPSAVQSPNGDVPYGSKAESPDGTMYAMEIEPYGNGNIGIFRKSDNTLLRVIDVLPGYNYNVLKALAWDRESKHLAAMYHGGMDYYGVNLWNAETGAHEGYLGPGSDSRGWYHNMVFSRDNAWIFAGYRNQFPTGIAPRYGSFIAHSGANLPWGMSAGGYHLYGWHIGDHPWGGNHEGFSNPATLAVLEAAMADLAAHGIKIVRVFIFGDGRSGIITDANDTPIGFDEYVYPDMDVLVNMAAKYNLKLIPVLLDYRVADGIQYENGKLVGEHPTWFTDPAKRTELLNRIASIVFRYRNSPAIYAWEPINEPELISTAIVPLADTKQFIKDCFITAKGYNYYVVKTTLGYQLSSTLTDPNWADIKPDIYQFHYYDKDEPTNPFDRPAATFGLDKPILIGECEPTNILYKLDRSYANKYHGIIFWSYNDGYYSPVYRAGMDNVFWWTSTHQQ